MMLIKGKAYRTNPPGILQLRVLRRLKAEFGFGWGTIMAFMQAVDDETPMWDLLGDEQFLAWVWAWVLNSGEQMTRAELEALEVSDIEFTTEDVTEEPSLPDEPVDPTKASDLTDSGQDGAVDLSAKRQTRASTRTSRKQSATASS